MIPKIIHYCWFGGKELPEDAKACINSWKKNCPDYEIVEWNEGSFNVFSNEYTKEAFENKKWAFITDYVRLYAMYTCGGIYMDTDVEVLKPLDDFLQLKGFSGFERFDRIPTGIMAAEKNLPFIGELLKEYDNRRFVKPDGSLDLTTNVETITNQCLKYGLKLNNEQQTIMDFTFYPFEFFCPKDYQTLELKITSNTYTIHHFSGSWAPKKTSINLIIKKILGPRLCKIITNIKYRK